MVFNFKQTSYLESVKQGVLGDEEKIFFHAHQTLKFKYADVNYPKFKANYATEGWLGRKVIALPAAIWFGIVKTIFHLSKLIFTGIQALYSGDKKNFNIQYFRAIRNFQESFGHLASLFNDQYGQYHIQESKFHQSCYDCFEIDLDKEVEKTRIESDLKEKNLRFALLAEVYFKQNNLEKASELIQLSSNSSKKEILLTQIAEAYLERKDFDKVFQTLKIYEIFHKGSSQEQLKTLTSKIANIFFLTTSIVIVNYFLKKELP